MKLNEFRRRWINGEEPRPDFSIDDSKIERIDAERRLAKQPTAWQPLRMRQKYVPEADGDGRSARFRQAAARGLIIVLVFVASLIVLGVMLDHLPVYLTTYVFDR